MKKKIVIIDDNRMKSNYLQELLEDLFDVYTYTSGAEALAALPKLDVQCILLDIEMPDENGFDVIKRIKKLPSICDIPVIFITNLSGWDMEIKGFDCGGSDFVGSNSSPEIIRARVQNLVELYGYKKKMEEKVRESTRTIFELQDAIMIALSNLVEFRDENTSGHAQRTRLYVQCLIKTLAAQQSYAEELSDEFIRDLVRAAPLHDIGKIGIPDAILNKPSKLSPEEFEEMKKHTIFGATAIFRAMHTVHKANFLSLLRDISLSHHEKWDGTGYPLGLDGHRIPLCGRIMAVADVYDALVSKRPYKGPMSHDEAAEIIIKGSGKHFDPTIIDAFVACQEQFREISQLQA